MTTYSEAKKKLEDDGFKYFGQDGMLGHLFVHNDGRTAKVCYAMFKGYTTAIKDGAS